MDQKLLAEKQIMVKKIQTTFDKGSKDFVSSEFIAKKNRKEVKKLATRYPWLYSQGT